ncbi:MAG: PIN domain-containing protein [Pseudonocardiales bacterium]
MSSGPTAVSAATEAASRDPSSVVADTHVLIWYFTAPSMLSATAIQILEDAVAADRPIIIAAVSLIELVYIAEKRSDSIDAETLAELLASIQASDSPISIAPMTVDVARHMISFSRTQVRDPFNPTPPVPRSGSTTRPAPPRPQLGAKSRFQTTSEPLLGAELGFWAPG